MSQDPSHSPPLISSSSNSYSSSPYSSYTQLQPITNMTYVNLDNNISPNVGVNNGGNDGANVGTKLGTNNGTNPRTNITQPLFLSMASLNLPDLSQLLNDPLLHDLNWLPMPTNIPMNFPNLERNLGDDSTDHIKYFYMWCSSSSIMDDLVHLHLFHLFHGTYLVFATIVNFFLSYI